MFNFTESTSKLFANINVTQLYTQVVQNFNVYNAVSFAHFVPALGHTSKILLVLATELSLDHCPEKDECSVSEIGIHMAKGLGIYCLGTVLPLWTVVGLNAVILANPEIVSTKPIRSFIKFFEDVENRITGKSDDYVAEEVVPVVTSNENNDTKNASSGSITNTVQIVGNVTDNSTAT